MSNIIIDALRNLARGDAGQDLIEYGLLAALIAVAAAAAVGTLGKAVTVTFWNVIAAQHF